MSRIPDLPEEIEHIPGVLRAQIDWPEVDGPAVLEIVLDPGTDREEALEQVLSTLRDVSGIDLGSLRPQTTTLPPPPPAQPVGGQEAGETAVAGAFGESTAPEDDEPSLGMGAADRRRGSEPSSPGGSPGSVWGRPAFRELHVERGATSLRVQVRLDWQGRPLTGEAAAVATERGALHAVAEATLAAVDGLLPVGVAGRIEWADAGRFGFERVVTVGGALVSERSEAPLVGGALVRRDRWDATVRATLDAFNRQLVQPDDAESSVAT